MKFTTYFDNYCNLYPNIVIEILEYFDFTNKIAGAASKRSVSKFCELHKSGGEIIYQPRIVSRICEVLCENGKLDRVMTGSCLGLNDNYTCNIKDLSYFSKNKNNLRDILNLTVYGIEFVYEKFKECVIPIVWDRGNGEYSAGTAFKFLDGIVTAKHCLEDAENIQIKGYKAEELEGKSVYISDNEGVDLAFIHTGTKGNSINYYGEGEILQEVLVIGYPKIPTFTNFQTAEKGTISSKASARITPTKGAIASVAHQYLTNIEAMLITARIRGGNSGGPVISEDGYLVGVACQLPDARSENGDYDDLGYGVALPVQYLMEIVENKPRPLDIPVGFYRDFVE